MKTIKELNDISTQIRRDLLRMINAVKSGHPGGSLGCADLFTALYFNILNHDPANFSIDGKEQDLFFLSNGHLSAVWYCALARSGYFPINELGTFRKLGTRLQGHPTPADEIEGVRIASGSLGQGLSVAIGAALTKKLNKENNIVYCLMGDGELQEGQVWEAAMFAAAKKIDNIIAIVDYNKKQIDGPVKDVLDLGNLNKKWDAFGWDVLEMDGNNIEEVINIINEAKHLINKSKPIVIIMKTIMGKGVDFMEDNHNWHGVAPNDEQLNKALSQLKETIGDY
ncbi:MAG: transketolase [Bacteroidetes bacterium GWE2_29_8]|nr:MAG: transketolase [Bacteroidetes bacterium GWE2_29_8]OFY22827.1 MAG: transketolase [Bacteroidetes bacterium GWF2_29_10]